MGQHDEGAAAGALDDDGEELGIDGAKGRVPRTLRHPYVVVALLPFQGLAVDVSEFRRAHHTERHLENKSNKRLKFV